MVTCVLLCTYRSNITGPYSWLLLLFTANTIKRKHDLASFSWGYAHRYFRGPQIWHIFHSGNACQLVIWIIRNSKVLSVARCIAITRQLQVICQCLINLTFTQVKNSSVISHWQNYKWLWNKFSTCTWYAIVQVPLISLHRIQSYLDTEKVNNLQNN